jgi:hypothetical protein
MAAMKQGVVVLLCLLGIGLSPTSVAARQSRAREVCTRVQAAAVACDWAEAHGAPGCPPGASIVFSGQVTGGFVVPPARRLGVTVFTRREAPDACTINMTLAADGGKDFIQITGSLPKPLREGTYPVRYTDWNDLGAVAVLAAPRCDRTFNKCAPSGGFYRGDHASQGSLELIRITRERVEGRFSAVSDGTFAFETSGEFSAGLVGVGNNRLSDDHPCVPPCPPDVELPEYGIPEPVGHRDPVLSMTPEGFGRDEAAQARLFEMARAVRERQGAFGQRQLALTKQGGVARSILKRDGQAEFAAGVIAKAGRNRFHTIGEMDDMVRGRFDLCAAEDARNLAEALLFTLPAPGTVDDEGKPVEGPYIRLPKAELPRRPVTVPECPCGGAGYPRYHVIVQDPETGVTHEWQIGTGAVSDVYELAGVVFPPGMWLDFESGALGPDLHDVDYDIFRQGVRGHDREHGENMYETLGLAAFGERLDQLSAAAHCQGYALEDLDARIAALHAEASELLQKVVDHYGIEQVRQWYH